MPKESVVLKVWSMEPWAGFLRLVQETMGQDNFPNNTKMLFAFYIVKLFALMVQKRKCWFESRQEHPTIVAAMVFFTATRPQYWKQMIST